MGWGTQKGTRPAHCPADDSVSGSAKLTGGGRGEGGQLIHLYERTQFDVCSPARIRGRRGSGGGCMARGAIPEEQARPLTWRDIRGTTRCYADELISTEAEAASLEALRVATGEMHG